jgi:hypothetical protein
LLHPRQPQRGENTLSHENFRETCPAADQLFLYSLTVESAVRFADEILDVSFSHPFFPSRKKRGPTAAPSTLLNSNTNESACLLALAETSGNSSDLADLHIIPPFFAPGEYHGRNSTTETEVVNRRVKN